MNNLSPLFFPGSIINSPILLSLATCFQDIQLLKPVKETNLQPSLQSNDCVTENTFCQVHIPCPLDEKDQQGFLQLVNDIRIQGSAFVTQLKMLTLADMSSPGGQQQESSRKILSALFPQEKKEQQIENHDTALELWQARLILKLAEIIDEEEKLVAQQMGSINLLETRMLKDLQGNSEITDDDHLIFPATQRSLQQTQPAATTGKQLKAWSTLYRYWDSQDVPLWVTATPEAADIVLDKYEKKQGSQAVRLMHLSLPTIEGAGEQNREDFHKKVTQFRTDADQLRTQFSDLLVQALQAGTDDHLLTAPPSQDTTTFEEQWRKALNMSFPEQTYGRTTLTFHLLNNISFGELVNKKEGKHSPFNNAVISALG